MRLGERVQPCSRCGRPAKVALPYAKLRLCEEHFVEYFESRVMSTISRYRMVERGQRVLAALSGGKDSQSMLVVLAKASKVIGFELVAAHVDLGIGGYSEESRRAVEELTRHLSVPLVVVSLRELLGCGLPELSARSGRPPCSVCGAVKRYLLNAIALELGAERVALGHHMDDLMMYIYKAFVLQDLSYLAKLGPMTETRGDLVGRVRPLYETPGREVALYALLKRIPSVSLRCPFAHRSKVERLIKGFLDSLDEEAPSLRISFARAFARNLPAYAGLTGAGKVSGCPVCGTPSSGGLCSFCKMTKKALGEPLGRIARERIRTTVVDLGLSTRGK